MLFIAHNQRCCEYHWKFTKEIINWFFSSKLLGIEHRQRCTLWILINRSVGSRLIYLWVGVHCTGIVTVGGTPYSYMYHQLALCYVFYCLSCPTRTFANKTSRQIQSLLLHLKISMINWWMAKKNITKRSKTFIQYFLFL